jgi:hypothetical protein
MASTPAQEIEEAYFSNAHKGQEIALQVIKTWVDTVQAVTAEVPPNYVPAAGWLPKAEDVVASAYDFAAQVLGSQRKFAEGILKTTAPLLPGYGKAAPEGPVAK